MITQWSSKCPRCWNSIQVGSEAEYNADGKLIHVICPGDDTMKVDEIHCPVCFLIHRRGECDYG